MLFKKWIIHTYPLNPSDILYQKSGESFPCAENLQEEHSLFFKCWLQM